MNPLYIALLEELGADVTSHSRGTLLEHLRGTHDLLEQWGNPPPVCVAGLFHSIYGTYAFDKQSADMNMRERIRDVIGADAEWLVFVFCVTDRRCFYDYLGEPRFKIRDIVHDRDLELDRDTLAALIEIEVANMLDQVPRRSRKKALRAAEFYSQAFARSRDYLTSSATRAAERCFATLLGESPYANETP
jgi:hypothetical protein